MRKLSRRKFVESSAILAGASYLSAPTVASAVGTNEASSARKVHPAPGMPAPRIVSSNSINMAVYEQGNGLPVIFCHGFPELAYSWRNQIAAFADSGIHAIVPDQRGYGLTDRPAQISDYATDILVDDIAGLLDTLQIDRPSSAVTTGAEASPG